MRSRHLRPGATLPDLIITLAVLAILTAMAAPRLMRARDAYAARAARDAAAALIEQTRVQAAARGTARLVVDPQRGTLVVQSPAGGAAAAELSAGDAFGITVTVDGHSTGVVALDFNALGLGVVANRTLRFHRGAEEARLSLSTYGRVRRW
jgi:Tfp pilus assembly protein FimT